MSDERPVSPRRRPLTQAIVGCALLLAVPGCGSGAAGDAGTDSERSVLATRPRYTPLDVHRGWYSSHFERSGFQPCGSSEDWWLEFARDSGVRDALRTSAGRFRVDTLRDVEQAYLEFRGDTSPRGEYGHLGKYDREVWVRELVRVAPDAPARCAR